MLLALRYYNDDRGNHGQSLTEATNPKADPNEYGPYRYVATGPFTDWAEKARLDAQDQYRKAAGDDPNLNGMYWRVEKHMNGPQPEP